MSTVYLVCPLSTPDVDMKPVEVYGRLEIINSRFVYSDEIVNELLPSEFRHKLEDAGENFDPVNDYLVLGGDHLQFVCMAAMLGSWYGQFRVLRWDRMARGYISALIFPG